MNARSGRLACVALALALALGACAPLPARTPVPWQEHVAALEAAPRWRLDGKIGLRAGSRGGSAQLGWQQDGEHFRLVMSGALGLGRLVLDGDPRGVRWSGGQGRGGRHDDPEALVRELWGWTVPVGALRYWVRGIPDPALPVGSIEFADNGLATRFRQAGWTIEPSAWRSAGALQLPGRVRLAGESATLTVSVGRWDVPPA